MQLYALVSLILRFRVLYWLKNILKHIFYFFSQFKNLFITVYKHTVKCYIRSVTFTYPVLLNKIGKLTCLCVCLCVWCLSGKCWMCLYPVWTRHSVRCISLCPSIYLLWDKNSLHRWSNLVLSTHYKVHYHEESV